MKYIMSIFLFVSLCQPEGLYFDNYSYRLNPDSVEIVEEKENTSIQPIHYPARPMLYSLILPGAGQVYNKSPWWKSALFAGVEVTGIAMWWNWKSRAEDIRLEYEAYADENWTLSDWYTNTRLIFPDTYSTMFAGTHKITLKTDDGYFSSAFLDSLWGLYGSDIQYIRDRNFYENIGKYDQFVGGWDDCYDEDGNQIWFEEAKSVGDSTEYIKLTPKKNYYRDLRFDSNTLLDYSKYAISALMFNHVISGLEAVWSSSAGKKEESDNDEIQSDIGLLYNRKSPAGIGGIYVSFKW
ncbi:MAG: hypothetical protein HOD97_04785 [Candidatus Marinimicrobia bacterium]|jgi:hypothetical protein|nr:hypothetical protein [Candidatus Neomarinimicrobiota bacterium]MBT3618117.1 hypothetical protein [Candidatus Neomarinimicrobiota bacterium]MBT3828588.1 hypothetical protein [Candidatus Neomarinimicrobiota bacterium]MBT3996950.1 hypothetical protein [Candidatus Neomarinimicrobiota bacterium]MBT4280914.1 hypothetical protein [Candidatus Neomarinimicrobiota bacterium]